MTGNFTQIGHVVSKILLYMHISRQTYRHPDTFVLSLHTDTILMKSITKIVARSDIQQFEICNFCAYWLYVFNQNMQ